MAIFLLIVFASMMLPLVPDVVKNALNLRFADRERRITWLPGESGGAKPLLVDPVGRVPLYPSYNFRHRPGWMLQEQQVKVIGHSIDDPSGATKFKQLLVQVVVDLSIHGRKQ